MRYPCTKGENGGPCGNAREGPKTADQCPRCWIELHSNKKSRPSAVVIPAVQKQKATALPVLHPDRCDHFTGVIEPKPGCSGWKCKGGCDLNLPAMPGFYCQTCTSYVVDPDYEGRGKKGWLM